MKNLNSEVENLLSQVMKESSVTGVTVLAGTQEKITFSYSIGQVHSSEKEKITSDTLFDIQSITKVLATASLLEKFIELKKLNLNDPIRKFISEFDVAKYAEIKVKDLVLHTSGISDEDFNETYANSEELWSKMLSPPLHGMPGKSTEYSDVGYRLLGLCLERLENDDLESLCKKHVWRPLGMNSTTYDVTKIEKKNIAGHGKNWCKVDDSQDQLLDRPLGCDGVFSSANDLSLFCQNFLKKFNDEAYLKKFMAVQRGDINPKWSFYESLGLGKKIYGWEAHSKEQSYIGKCHTPMTIEKAGGGGAFISIRPEQKDFFIYMTNNGRPHPFTMDAWDHLVTSLRSGDLAKKVLSK